MGDEKWQPEMPPVESGERLVGYLMEIGPGMPAGMGLAPISHLEILAWTALTGVVLAPWEVRALRKLSMQYVQELNAAQEPDRPAPWVSTAGAEQAALAESLKQSIRRLAAL